MDPLTDAPTTVRLRCEEDAIALCLVTLGFHPTDSLVLICVDDAGRTFQARGDLAPTRDGVADALALLLPAVERNGGRTVLALAFTGDDRLARAHLRAATRALERSGRRVLTRLRIHEDRWFPLSAPARVPGHAARVGVRFDLSSHPLVARAVLAGEVLHADRDALVQTLEPAAGPVRDAVAEAWRAQAPLDRDDPGMLLSEAEWLQRRLADDAWPPVTLARVLRAVAVPAVRDVVLCSLQRRTAAAQVLRWRTAVRLAPEQAVASPAALLGFASWLAGDGALAWCAVDRALAAEPAHSLAGLVADALVGAVDPGTWVPMEVGELPLFRGGAL